MLSKILVLSRAQMIQALQSVCGHSSLSHGSRLALLSIVDSSDIEDDLSYAPFSGGNWAESPSGASLLAACGVMDVISICFGDITEASVSDRSDLLPLLMTQQQASSIVVFVQRLCALSEPVTLLVHCAAGVSRSPAVGLFAARISGIGDDAFLRAHPGVMPNPFVLRMLMESSGLRDSRQSELCEVFT